MRGMREKTSRLVWLIAILAVIMIIGGIVGVLLPAIQSSNLHRP
jgi:hypothetical protein